MTDELVEVRQKRKRGVPLNDLDRSRRWVIGFTGRRWEVLGSVEESGGIGWVPGRGRKRRRRGTATGRGIARCHDPQPVLGRSAD